MARLNWTEIGGGLLWICTNKAYKIVLNHEHVPVTWDLYTGVQTGKWVLVRVCHSLDTAMVDADRFEDGFV